jgi:hypothetical protein
MKSLFAFCLTLCAITMASSGALAQTQKPAPGTLPSAEHQRLAPLVGRWDVTIKFKVGPDKFQHGTADCTANWMLDGNFLQLEYRSSMNGQPFTVLQILGYDTTRQQFTELYLNNLETAVMHNTGTLAEDGKSLTFLGEHFDMLARRMAKLRTVYTLTDPDHFTLEWFQTGADGKEERVVTLTHLRRTS